MAEILSSIAAVLWPIVVLVLAYGFRSDIRGAVGRIKKGKVFGQEFELDHQIKELRENVNEAEKELPENIYKKLDESSVHSAGKNEGYDGDFEQELIKQSASMPEFTVIRLVLNILKRRLMFSRGLCPRTPSREHCSLHPINV